MAQSVYLHARNHFFSEPAEDKVLRQQLKCLGIDARRLSRFSQLALLGALPLKEKIRPNTSIYLGSGFSSPSKFNKMFYQLNTENVPSPLDFMANLNNSALFQLAQALNTTGNSVFLAVNGHNYLQPLKLAVNDLHLRLCDTALVGWAFEHYRAGQSEGSCWWLVSREAEHALAEIHLDMQKQPKNRPHFLSYLIGLETRIMIERSVIV